MPASSIKVPNLAGNRSSEMCNMRWGKGKISSPVSLVYESSLPDVEKEGDDGALIVLLLLVLLAMLLVDACEA